MKKLDIIKEMNVLESKKELLSKQVDRITQHTKQNEPLTISFKTETQDYNTKGTTQNLEFTNEKLVDYIHTEIDKINTQVDRLINKLKVLITGGIQND